jgi:hypothetical protein
VCSSSVAGNQECSSSVPSYPAQQTKYSNLHFHWLSILESRMSVILYSTLLSISIEGGRGWVQFGIVFRVAGSSWETWKTGWIAWRWSGSRRVTE